MASPAIGKIGLGTGNLYGGRERKRSIKLVRTALEVGISWIDTAPLYGHGAAEAIVGEALAGYRDMVCLVSKVGILPSHVNFRYRLQGRLAALAAKVPGGRAVLAPPLPRRPTFHVFEPCAVRTSVERSLSALRTDRLDYLLLHECDPGEATDPRLLETLQDLRRTGKVLGFGTATQPEKTADILKSPAADCFDLIQLPGAAGTVALDGLNPKLTRGAVLHSVLGAPLKTVLARLQADPAVRAKAQDLGIDPDNPDLARRLVASALRLPGVRAVLFSTTNAERLRAMADAAAIGEEEAEAGVRLLVGANNV